MRQSVLEFERFDVKGAARPMAARRASQEAPRMLIEDDDPWIVGMLADNCGRMGFEIDTAANGLQAILKASRGEPDVLVIDVKMPEVDGLSVCGQLLDADKAPASVIVITGGRDPNAVERCKGFGAYYVRKGRDFWNDLEAALVEIHPLMAGRIRENCTYVPAPARRSRI